MYSLNKFPTIKKIGFDFNFNINLVEETNEKKLNHHSGGNGTQLKGFYSTKTITFQWFVFDGLKLENFKPFYYKTDTIALISNYLFSARDKKVGERLSIWEEPVPLLARGGLKEENGVNHILLRKEEKLLDTTVL